MTPVESVSSFFERNPQYRGKVITLAFSGGYDSLCLLASLCELGFDVHPVYVNHNIRSESELSAEIKLNMDNCRRLGCALEVITLERGSVDACAHEKGLTCEAAARFLRYEALSSFPLVATAHNRDDQVESLMMKLISGGTLLSLAGIRERRENLIRPLLCCTRSEIVSYVDSLQLQPSSDSTNDELFCFRNKVRQLVTPYLGSSVKDSLVRIAENIQKAEDLSENIHISNNSGYYSVSRKNFITSSFFSKLKCIYHVYSFFDSSRISGAEIRKIVDCIQNTGSYDSRFFHLRCTRDEVRFYHLKTWFAAPFEKNATLPYGLSLEEMCSSSALRIDPSLLNPPVLIRLSDEDDTLLLSSRSIRLSDLCASFKCPYAFVLQDLDGIKAVWAECFGGRNRLSDTLRSGKWKELTGLEVVKKG